MQLYDILTGEVLGCDVNTEYQCANSKCIPLTSFNNSYNDCGDNSDEGNTKYFSFGFYLAVLALDLLDAYLAIVTIPTMKNSPY